MNIALVGAIDRYNYGDVLFPIIIEHELSNRMDSMKFKYYGYKKADLSRFGAHKTLSVYDMNLDDTDAIIVVGGEVLTSSWSLTYIFLQDNYHLAHTLKLMNRVLREKIFNWFVKRRLRVDQPLPWVFDKSHYPSQKIIYNSVGGAAYGEPVRKLQYYLKDALNQADFISVREHGSKKILTNIGVNNVMEFPDSAFIMSDIFPLNKLAKLSRFRLKNKRQYIVFQVSMRLAAGNEEIIAQQLMQLCLKTKYDIVLLPIGQAALHEDTVPLTKIFNKLQQTEVKNRVTMVKDNTIYDTMSIIANSELFIGTSLHGNVTALSYGTPSVGIDSRVVKLTELLQKYSLPEQEYAVPYENIAQSALKSLSINKSELISNSVRIKTLVGENFDLIASELRKG